MSHDLLKNTEDKVNQMASGFITSVQGKIICDKFVVVTKVLHSQHLNESPLPVWIITNKEDTDLSTQLGM